METPSKTRLNGDLDPGRGLLVPIPDHFSHTGIPKKLLIIVFFVSFTA